MALTTDKRRNITTISSQSNRMGVVRAYSGDAVGVLAENMSKKLDFFAKRQAVLEENKYKADTQHKVYKAIQEYGRTHFDNPAAFSDNTNAYMDSAVKEAPKRFKNWTKSLISMEAAREGEKIFNRRLNLDFIESAKAIDILIEDINDQVTTDLYGMSLDKVDSYWAEQFIPKLSEIYKQYTDLYNSAYPEQKASSNMLPPEEWLKTRKVAFETAKVTNEVKTFIDSRYAELIETTQLTTAGTLPVLTGANGITTLKQDLQNLYRDYINDPAAQFVQGASSYIETSADDRSAIIKQVDKFANSYIDTFVQENRKVTVLNDLQANGAAQMIMNDAIIDPSSYVDFNIANFSLQYPSLDSDTLKKVNDRVMIGQLIYSKVNSLFNNDSSNVSTTQYQPITQAVNELLPQINLIDSEMFAGEKGTKELKSLIGRVNLKNIISDRYNGILNGPNINITEGSMPNLDRIVILNEETQEFAFDDDFRIILEYAARNNINIPQIDNFINNVTSLNVSSKEDLMRLHSISYMVNYLNNRNGFSYDFSNVPTNVKAALIKFDKIRNFETTNLPPKDIAQTFFNMLNKDNETLQNINTKINSFIGDGEEQINKEEIVANILNKNRKKFYTPAPIISGKLPSKLYTTGEATANEDKLFNDTAAMQTVVMPLLELYLSSVYENEYQVTKETLLENIELFTEAIAEEVKERGFFAVRGN